MLSGKDTGIERGGSMSKFKNVLLKILQFVRIIVPIVCVVIFGLCWAMDLANSNKYGHHFNGQPPAFWQTIKFISDVMLINACVFVVSFTAFTLVRPLPVEHKALRILLRLFITVITCAIFLLLTYVSLGAFVGWGG